MPVTPEPAPASDPLAPLARWYQAAGQTAPDTVMIAAEAMPQPYRQLLVHERDMTSTLEAFHDGKLHLRVLGSRRLGHIYQREVVLQLDGPGWPVEFGATQIYLDALPAEAQALILEGRRPFGGIIRACAVAYRSQPKAYFQIEADATIREAFRLAGDYTLYGRCNTIYDRNGRIIAEIVEILPPSPLAAPPPRQPAQSGAAEKMMADDDGSGLTEAARPARDSTRNSVRGPTARP